MKQANPFMFCIAFFSLFSFCLGVNAVETPLQSQERVSEGQFYTSHPTSVRVIKTDSRHHSNMPETLLRVTMETIVPNRAGTRVRNIFFSQQYVSEYIEVIDRFIRMSRDGHSRDTIELARVSSWESFNTKRDLVFEYISAEGNSREGQNTPLLGISLAYDVVHKGGSFYFTPANAQELLNLLFGFIDEI